MTVAPPPAAYRLLEGWGKAAVAPTSGSCIGGHPRILFRALRADYGRLPELCPGRAENPVGRWTVQMAAGANGGAPVNRTYYEHGIHTILATRIDERDLRQLEQPQNPRAKLSQGLEVIVGAGVIRP